MNLSDHDQHLYWIWAAMIQRCTNPKEKSFSRYGGRGISVCERWRNSFTAFLQDIGERPDGHTLERLDSNGDYTPENCKWATYLEQNNNRSWCIYVEVDGERLSLKQAWRKHATIGLTYRAFHKRVDKGMALDRALSMRPRGLHLTESA